MTVEAAVEFLASLVEERAQPTVRSNAATRTALRPFTGGHLPFGFHRPHQISELPSPRCGFDDDPAAAAALRVDQSELDQFAAHFRQVVLRNPERLRDLLHADDCSGAELEVGQQTEGVIGVPGDFG